ncbi:MAG: serine/threonine-protein kinase [Gemmataceae bacterium]
MPVNYDAAGIGQLALRLGLVSDAQLDECLVELGNKKAPGTELVRLLERKRYLSAWQGAKLLKGETDGYFLGGYRLLYRIASGSFGRVYRGDDPMTGQVVAVKVLRNKWMQDKQKVDLFLREGKLGMTIRHPNIVSVLTVNQDSKTGQYFIVMEFIEGGNLRDLLQIRKKLTPDESARIIEESAQGLAYSFQRGLTHRDIKPTNILIAVANGQAKLVDFGLAEISENTGGGQTVRMDKEDKDDDVAVDRTVDYAGLEKATNQRAGDVRSDIYFLGSVLFECVTGTPLMPATRDRQERMQARRYQEVEATLHRSGPALGVPPPLLTVLSKALAFDPNRRYQTPTELVEALQRCRAELRGEEVEPEAPPSRRPPGPKTLFALESNERLKDKFREKFKAKGFRVLLSTDPNQAIKRYQQQPFHALIVNAGSIGDDAIEVHNQLIEAADSAGYDLATMLLLSQEQVELAVDATEHDRGAIGVFPMSMKELLKTLDELMNSPEEDEEPQDEEPEPDAEE